MPKIDVGADREREDDATVAKWRRQFEEMGEPAVRAKLAVNHWPAGGKAEGIAREWIAEKKEERAEADRKASIDRETRAVGAAEDAAKSAKEANAHFRTSNLLSLFALLGSLLALLKSFGVI